MRFRSFVIVFIIFICFYGYSQRFEFGPAFGGGGNTLRGYLNSWKPGPAANAGLQFKFNFAGGFGVSLNTMYEFRGVRGEFTLTNQFGVPTTHIIYFVKHHYCSAPLLIRWQSGGKLKLLLGAGAELNYLFYKQTQLGTIKYNAKSGWAIKDEEKIEYGPVVNIGFSVPMKNRNRFQLELKNYFATSRVEGEVDARQQYKNTHTLQLTFSFGK